MNASFDLVPAVHSAFDAQGAVRLEAVDEQARFLAQQGIRRVFVAGTTGEGLTLREDERRELTTAWVEAGRQHTLSVWIHVGGNSVAAACALAAHAQAQGADGVAAVTPHFVGPGSVEDLVALCAEIAAAAPQLPFYHYDIPALSGVHFDPVRWLGLAQEQIPSLGGIKYTNPDLAALQECLVLAGETHRIYYGQDESLLAGLALGVHGAVGSTYNFAAPLAQQVVRAHADGDVGSARQAQLRIVALVRTLQRFGYLRCNKAVLGMLGVTAFEGGEVRAPLATPSGDELREVRQALEELGFFTWLDEARA